MNRNEKKIEYTKIQKNMPFGVPEAFGMKD